MTWIHEGVLNVAPARGDWDRESVSSKLNWQSFMAQRGGVEFGLRKF
jgi:hypothetical protein